MVRRLTAASGWRRLIGMSAAALVASGVAAPALATDRLPDPPLVALGDSYASGLGTRTYTESSGACYRSPLAYAPRAARRIGMRVRFEACAGATVRDVRASQVGALTRRTRRVTVTIGGNDARFTDVLVTCAQPAWASNCRRAVERSRRIIRTKLPRRWKRLVRTIRHRSPRARVVVVGYPRLFMGEDCNAGTFFSPREQRWLNATANLLARRERRAVRGPRVRFVDPRRAFVGHAVCDDHAWINGLSDPINESFHPNVAGQRALSRLVVPQIR